VTLSSPDEWHCRSPAGDGRPLAIDLLIHSKDSDAVARYLLTATSARDLEINTRGLEDAFIALTSHDSDASDSFAGGSR